MLNEKNSWGLFKIIFTGKGHTIKCVLMVIMFLLKYKISQINKKTDPFLQKFKPDHEQFFCCLAGGSTNEKKIEA